MCILFPLAFSAFGVGRKHPPERGRSLRLFARLLRRHDGDTLP
jgi:hypothetical protein